MMFRLIVFILLLFGFNCSAQTYTITNVNVLPMARGDSVIMGATVIISDRQIKSLTGPVPRNAKVIDGKNKWLLPGLIDVHAHIPTDIHFGKKLPTQGANFFFNTQDLMTPFIANGVTTVFELNSRPEHFSQRNAIEQGSVTGPRMALAALINGGENGERIANTPEDGRQTVRIAKSDGYEYVKLYSALNVPTFLAIVDEAHKQGMRTVGHIPDAFKGKLDQAFVPHFDMVAHAEEFSKHSEQFTDEDAKRFAQLAKQNGTWLSPTLIAMKMILSQAKSLDAIRNSATIQYVHPLLQSKWLTANSYNKNSSPERVAYFQKMVDFHIKLVKAFKEAGVPMVVGTDAGLSGIVGGFSLHDELELLVEAGLTPGDALAGATRLAAEWLGIDSLVGSIEPGKYADLILLDANPMENIKNTRNIAGVFVNGKWLDKQHLNVMLADLAKRNKAGKDKYDWKTIRSGR